METSLQLVTYNIHKGFSPGKISFQLHKMRDALGDVGAELLLLQEVQGEHKRHEKLRGKWPDESQFEFLAESLWPHYAYAKNAVYQAGHHGNAILSKYPIIDWHNIDVSTAKRASRSVLHAVIEHQPTKQVIHVICIHFGLFKNERADQYNVLIDRINQVVGEDEPLIIAGDFNEWRRFATHSMEAELGLEEVFKCLQGDYAKSFPALRPTLKTDRIYYRGLTIEEGKVLTGKPWRLLSDHLPLYASFKLNST